LFTIEKDVEYYKVLNYHDGSWLSGTWIKALENRQSLDAQVTDNAKWMIKQDEIKKSENNKPDSIPK
jgi:hypothetical protein